MAIYHLHAQVIGRKAGRSAVAAAAYRAGEKLIDERAEKTHDYSRKGGVVHAEILAPGGAPEWVHDRQQLWNAVEAAEKRKDAQLAREIDIALPRELDRAEQISLVREFVQREFVERGMVADIAVHDTDGTNPHAHIMLTMREIGADGFGKKVRAWNDKKLLEQWRAAWADAANAALERAGVEQRIDHRTLEAQGIEREPQIHLGVASHHAHQRGHDTPRYRRFEEIRRRNEIVVSEEAHAVAMAKRLSALFSPSEPPEAPPAHTPDLTPFPAPDPRLERLERARARLSELREQQQAAYGRQQDLFSAAARLRRDAHEHEQRALELGVCAGQLADAEADYIAAARAAGGWWHRALEALGIKTKAVRARDAAYERLADAFNDAIGELGHRPSNRVSVVAEAVREAAREAQSDADSLRWEASRKERAGTQHRERGDALQREIESVQREIRGLKRELGLEPQPQRQRQRQQDRGWEPEL